MAGDIFMKINTIDGESSVGGHEKEIDLLSWNWGATQPGTRHVAKGGGGGKVTVHDLTFTKLVDSASAKLMEACCVGTHLTEAKLVLRKADGKKALDYLKIKMTDVIITSVSISGSDGQGMPMEQIALNFAKYEYEYTPQNADGSGGAAITKIFDIAKLEGSA